MLNWATRFNIFCFLDNQGYNDYAGNYECLLGAGVKKIVTDFSSPLQKGNWYFGHLSYDLKDELYGFPKKGIDQIGFAPYSFFIPQVVIAIYDSYLSIQADDPETVFAEIEDSHLSHSNSMQAISVQQSLTKADYIEKIKQLQKHIQQGDCYEINYCTEFFAEGVSINPHTVFQNLIQISPNPYSALYRVHDSYLLCASPERFLKKRGNTILSQPMKGTIKRNLENKELDEKLKNALKQSQKDQSENVMVVDLVRNDLSKVCKEATVQVDELFQVYTYPQVHQMISTISGEVKDDVTFQDVIRAAFPMGSMTGAPKHRVMQLIDQYETSPRGIFSGTVGYINPDGDFDFNVVIRSIMYNAASNFLSYKVGSGITFYSNPKQEWEECLLKAEAIKKVLAGGPAL